MFHAMSRMRKCSNFYDTERLYPRSTPPLKCGHCKNELVITRDIITPAESDPSDNKTLFRVGIFGDIGLPNRYLELVYELLNSSEGDVFEITLQSPGGCVPSGFMIINAMEASKAKVITIANGFVASSAAFIWSFGHQLVVNDWSYISYHMSSHSDSGKSMQVAERAADTVEFIRMCMDKVHERGLITKEEFSRIVDEKSDVNIPFDIMKTRVSASYKTEAPDVVDSLVTSEGDK